MSVTINKLTYKISNRLGECGAKKGVKKQLYFPFFLMGACGEDDAVYSHNGTREWLIAPKSMTYNWFALLAKKLKENECLDWDWNSFRNNILAPNREHLKDELKLDDEHVDKLLEDGFVFLNNFYGTPADDGEDEDEWEQMRLKGEVGYYPNFKNFLEHPNDLEY